MGVRNPHQEPVKLFFAVMAAQQEWIDLAQKRLAASFGTVDLKDSPFLFHVHTDYYAEEFGEALWKQLVSVEPLIAPGDLPAIKIQTNALEWEMAGEREGENPRKRQVNIDPGYLCEGKVVLASCKDHWHRVYVAEGIFQEVTLRYRKKEGYTPLEWTYPDYADPERRQWFLKLRERYRQQKGKSPAA